MAIRARGAGQAPAADQLLSEQERARLLATGKELFMARYARCHNEHGDKPLKTGPPLNERGLSTDEIARAVNGRLRDKTREERRAVTLYSSSLMKTNAGGCQLNSFNRKTESRRYTNHQEKQGRSFHHPF
jgi:cytochrome c553